MIGPPKEITGPGPLGAWSRSLLRFLETFRLIDGPGYRIKRVQGGIILDLPLQPGGSAAPSPVLITPYTIAGMAGSGNAALFGGTAYQQGGQAIVPQFVLVVPMGGGDSQAVLLPYKLQAIPTETIDGVKVTYNYTENAAGVTTQQRTASTALGGMETQVIVPRYLPGDIIYCFSYNTGLSPTTTPPTTVVTMLIDANLDGRAWAASSGVV